MKKIGLMIIEDNKMLREGIRIMLKAYDEIEVVAALGDRVRIPDKIRALKPDVLLLDLGLVNQNSLELVKDLTKKFPKLKIIIMDLLPVQYDMLQFMVEGVCGFILKDATKDDFINTIRSCAKGDKIFPSQLQGSLFSEIVDNAVAELMNSKLIESIRMTELEKKIIRFVSEGLSDKEIAKKLILTVHVIKGHIDNILEKMSLNTRVQVAVYRNSGTEDITTSDKAAIESSILKKGHTKLDKLRDLKSTTNGKIKRKTVQKRST